MTSKSSAAPSEDDRTPRPRSSRALQWIAFIVLAAALYFAKALLIPVAIALLVWFTFGPWVRSLAKRRVPSYLSAGVIVICLSAAAAGAVYVASGPITRWMSDIPHVSAELRSKLKHLRQPIEEVAKAGDALESVSKEGAQGGPREVVIKGPGLLSMLAENVQYMGTTVAATLVLLYFLLASGSHFHIRLVESFKTLTDKKRALELVMLIERDVSRYVMSVALINVGLGCVIGLMLWAAGMPDPISWGVSAAVLNFMPYVGPLIGVIMIGVAAIIEFDQVNSMLLMPAIYAFCTVVEGQFVTPGILGKRFDINPVVILLAVAFWAWIWGIVGAFIAVPVLVAVKVISDNTDFAPWFAHFSSTARNADQD